jgi:hypothetical protein
MVLGANAEAARDGYLNEVPSRAVEWGRMASSRGPLDHMNG